MESVYDLCLLLEREAVSRTVQQGTDLTPAAPKRCADRAARSLAYRDFHRALYVGCDNPLLVSTLDALRDQTALISTAAWGRVPTWEREAGGTPPNPPGRPVRLRP